MQKRLNAPHHTNVLWYRGTKDGVHHLTHVYKMFGQDRYLIAASELFMPDDQIFLLNSAPLRQVEIKKVGGRWMLLEVKQER